MNIIKELQYHGVLLNQDTLEGILKPIINRTNLKPDYLKEQRVFYYTEDSRSMRAYSFIESPDSKFKIVKFNNTRNFFNHPWAFGFIKHKTSDGYVWKGAYAGRHGELFAKLKKAIRNPKGDKTTLTKVDFPRAITKVDVFKQCDLTQFISTLYKDLADKKEWDCLDGVEGLKTYIQNITYIARDKALLADVVPEETIISYEKGSATLLFNSGLFDRYSNFITIKVKLEKHNNSVLSEPYYAVTSMEKVTNLSNYGLEEAPPIMQFCEKTDLVFPSDKISLVDRQGIDHIFKERSNRLSEEMQNCTSEVLYNSLQDSVNMAIKRSKVDTQYLVPFLNMKWGKISYLMPFYVKHIDSENPLCAVVLGEVGEGVWAPVTVLRIETARSNARLLGRLNSPWLIKVQGGSAYEDCTG